MSSPQASLIEVPERGLIVVTDYEPVVARLVRLVELIDVAPEEVVTRIIAIRNADASKLASQVRTILREKPAPARVKAIEAQVLAGIVPGSVAVRSRA